MRQIADGLFSVADDLAGHLYVLNLGLTELSVIHEDAPGEVDLVLAPPGGNPDHDFGIYPPTWGGVAGPGVAPSLVFAWHTDHWTVTRIYADRTEGSPRIAQGSWDLYRYFRYQGPPGGPRRSIIPGGIIENGRIMLPFTLAGRGYGDLGPIPPFLPPTAGLRVNTTGINPPFPIRGGELVADTPLFFAFAAPLPTAMNQWPRAIYVLNKATGRWTVVQVPFEALWPRLFGDWLATAVQEPNPEGHESPGLANERPNEVDAGPVRELPRIRGMYPKDVYMPGKLLLQNLVDGRKITINTGQQDSEVLAIRKGGLVLYRVNDEVFSAQIERDKLGPSKLVVRDKEVPEIHWAFWSNTQAEPSGSVPFRLVDCAKMSRGKPFALFLSTTTPKVRTGSVPEFAVTIINCSGKTLDLTAGYPEGGPLDNSFRLQITDPSGKPVAPGFYHKLAPGEVWTGTTLVIRNLAPGHAFTEEAYDPSWTYKFDQAGKYRIKVFRGLPGKFGGGVLKSNVLTITVTK